MSRQIYKFKKEEVVIINFPDEVLTQARTLEAGNRRYTYVYHEGTEAGNSFTGKWTACDVLELHGRVYPIRARTKARYSIDVSNYTKHFFPANCLEKPTDELLWWRDVRNERFQEFTI